METRVGLAHCSIAGGWKCSACKEDMELEQKIQELQERRRQLRTEMNANHDPFVLKLPPEIASHIFFLSMDELDTPYLFGAVCKGWRQLARSTPQLWSRLAFCLPHRMDSTLTETLPHLVDDWLERSGGLPLSLHVFYDPSDSPGFPSNVFVSIINTLNQHSGRWHDVRLTLPVAYLRHLCPASPPKNLQNMSISGRPHAVIDISDPPRFTMNTRPGPMKFTIDALPLKAIDISWDRLVQLEVNDTSLDGILEVIRSAPLLEKCCLSDISPPTADMSETIIHHPHLRTLELLELRTGVFTKIVNFLELPSLESWSFDSELEESIIALDAISFLRRFGSGLKALTLYQDGEPAFEDFLSLLQAAPHLHSLKLVGEDLSSVMDNILEQMSEPPSHPMSQTGNNARFLSELQSLEFITGSELNAWAYIPLIFRWPHRKLLSLELAMGEVIISDEVSSELVQLVDQGIKLYIYDLSNGEDYLQMFRERGRLESGN